MEGITIKEMQKNEELNKEKRQNITQNYQLVPWEKS